MAHNCIENIKIGDRVSISGRRFKYLSSIEGNLINLFGTYTVIGKKIHLSTNRIYFLLGIQNKDIDRLEALSSSIPLFRDYQINDEHKNLFGRAWIIDNESDDPNKRDWEKIVSIHKQQNAS